MAGEQGYCEVLDCSRAPGTPYVGDFEDQMINTDYYKNKKVAIIGLARSGLASANLLYDLGAQVCVSDNSDNELLRSNLRKLKSKDIKVELGRHSQEFIKDKDLIVVSPGIPDEALPLVWANEQKTPIIGEIELASSLSPATVIAVTGSCGKTTVTTLIGRLLKEQGKNVFVCGNIGNPFSGEVAKTRDTDYVSLEVSSFQLERINRFKPKISVLLNFSRNHMDRYKNMEDYLEAKKRIFMNQEKSDYVVLNYDCPMLRDLASQIKAKIVYFSKEKDPNLNQAASLAVGSILGIDEKLILKVFREFKGIEHRLEDVAEINNIKFINDSKSTTADSLIWALKTIKYPIVLIAGGKDKGIDYSVILDFARDRVKEVILIGEAKEKIRLALKGALLTDEASSLEEAVNKAYLAAKSGDCVLLSPMCSSFDMFSNYEERGRVFKKAVYDLIKDATSKNAHPLEAGIRLSGYQGKKEKPDPPDTPISKSR